MFYYKISKKPKLEVRITESYTEADLDRLLFFIDGLVLSPNLNVVFKVTHSIQSKFKESVSKRVLQPLYTYQIKELRA